MVSWLDVVGGSPKAQVIDVLLHAERDLPVSEIHARAPDLSPEEALEAIHALEGLELVEQTRGVGDVMLYEVDRSARVMSDIRKVKRSVDKYVERPEDGC